MAAVVPLASATLVKLGDPGGAPGRREHSTLKRFPSSSRRTTLEALEQQFNQQRSKEILRLLKEAIHLIDCENVETDPESYAVLLKSCTDADCLLAGQFIHQHISANGYEHLTFLSNFLIEMYGKCGALDDARFLFESMEHPNVFSWTIIIAAYAHYGCFEDAYKLFLQMRLKGAKPNEFTFTTVLGTCMSNHLLAQGRHLHACAIHDGFDSDVVVGTALVNMYGKCRSVVDAGVAFHKIQQHDMVAWNSMIAVLVEHGEGKKALLLFHKMVQDEELDKATFASILGACINENFLEQGYMIHARVVDHGYTSDLVITNALIDMYGKCGSPCSAGLLFNKLSRRDVVSWTAIIVAYVQHPREALQLFKHMLIAGFMPNEFTYATILTACTSLKAIRQGQLVHHCIIEAGLDPNIIIATALVGIYGKCINVKEALWVFNQVHHRDVVLWNAIIAIYAQQGLGKEAIDSLQQMEGQGLVPDEITFTSILTACSHAGLIKEGCGIYATLGRKNNIMPSVEHCGCMVDLFGRASLLREAEDFIECMHLKPNLVIWEIFLNACILSEDKCRIEYAQKVSSELAAK